MKEQVYNLLVIGGGSGGLVCAAGAAGLGARVALLEKDKMGGECLNTGCVPSKAIIRSGKIAHYIKDAAKYGIKTHHAEVDFSAVMQRVREVIQAIEPHDSVERFESLGVHVVKGAGRFESPNVVSNGSQRFKAKKIVISTGSSPFVPPVEGIEDIDFLTNENVWGLKALPKRLAVLGGGPIGCELAQTFARLGSKVSIVEMMPQLLFREDDEASEIIENRFREEGIDVLTSSKAIKVGQEGESKFLWLEGQDKQQKRLEFDELLVAVGRKPNVSGLNLEAVGIEYNAKGLVVDPCLRTTQKHVFACGDVVGPYLFTHTASYQAEYVLRNAFFPFPKKIDYSVIPWSTFTDPEVARVGLNEKEAKVKNIAYDVFHYPLKDLDRAICDGDTAGFVKILTQPGKDKLLGATIVGAHAGDLLHEFVLCMKQGLGLSAITGTIHVYPTLAELVRRGADQWRKTQLTPFVHKAFTSYFKFLR